MAFREPAQAAAAHGAPIKLAKAEQMPELHPSPVVAKIIARTLTPNAQTIPETMYPAMRMIQLIKAKSNVAVNKAFRIPSYHRKKSVRFSISM